MKRGGSSTYTLPLTTVAEILCIVDPQLQPPFSSGELL